MIEQISTVPAGMAALQLPPQAAPIDRSQAPLSAVAAGGGIEAATVLMPWPEFTLPWFKAPKA